LRNISVLRIRFLYVSHKNNFYKEKDEVLRCPLCGGKLDVDFKLKFASYASCGWIKVSESAQNEKGRATTLENFT
jgi:hypothetical protein